MIIQVFEPAFRILSIGPLIRVSGGPDLMCYIGKEIDLCIEYLPLLAGFNGLYLSLIFDSLLLKVGNYQEVANSCHSEQVKVCMQAARARMAGRS